MSKTAERTAVRDPKPTGAEPVRLSRCGDHACPPGACDDKEKEVLHRSASPESPGLMRGSVEQAVGGVLRSAGSPLPSGVRGEMEQRLGHDFGQVRIHTGGEAADSARAVAARAYTVGSHVVFGAGNYRPDTASGRRLLAHELTHVTQQPRGWSPSSELRVSTPGDPGEVEAERVAEQVANDSPATPRPLPSVRAGTAPGALLQRTWDRAQAADCAGRDPAVWLPKVVVDQEKAQSVTLHWSDGTVSASICSTGKGHCCVDESDPEATAGSVTESRRNGSNLTPITGRVGYVITDRYRSYNGWRFWSTFVPGRGIGLHQHHTVTGTPLSHGCVRLPVETAQAIFCGARQNTTRVEVRGFARPDCAEPEVQAEWRSDFRSAGATVDDGEPPDTARIIRKNREESRRILRESYGHELSESEIESGIRGELEIPRCGYRGAAPTTEERRAVPETGAAANLPSTASELLASSGLERFVPALTGALDRTRTLGAARAAVRRSGRALWTAATRAARRGSGGDRPLYWARLQMTRAIRQWEPGFRLSATQRDDLIETFDAASRGMQTAGFTGGRAVKRLLISGFDPFGFELSDYGLTRATNPSGAAALALDGRPLRADGVRGVVQSVIFPVSFAAFDAGMVERFFGPYLRGPGQADLIMTISMGGPGDDFEVEEWAGRSRRAGSPDNPGVTPATSGAPPGLGPGPEFIHTELPASARGALGRTAPNLQESGVVEIPRGGRRAVRRRRGPTAGATAVAGSGGGYLSNEIFYRVGVLQIGERTSIPFGHLHVPFLSPGMAGFERRRADIVRQVEQILTAVLPDI